MKKFLLITTLVFAVFLSGCELLEEGEVIPEDTSQLYEVNDVFQEKYDAQKAYVEKNSFDENGKNDLAETEANLLVLNEWLNDGIACRKYDARYDQLKSYFPWYQSMHSTLVSQQETSESFLIDEFCHSALAGSALFSYKAELTGDAMEYVIYGYFGDGVTKKHHSVIYENKVDCKLGDWTEDEVEWSCAYDKDGEKIEDKYSYDFFFEAATLAETCTGEGEAQVCEPAI